MLVSELGTTGHGQGHIGHECKWMLPVSTERRESWSGNRVRIWLERWHSNGEDSGPMKILNLFPLLEADLI